MTSGELADATIVFDLDGTLIDTAPDLTRALNETMDLEGLPHLKLETVRALVGQGARALVERATGLAGAMFQDDRLDQLTEAFIAFYRAGIARDSRPFPGLSEALDELASLGASFSVCTNKRTDLSSLLLHELGLAERFSAVVGGDAVTACKPHPDHFCAAVMRAGGALDRSMMVGDTMADVAAAHGAGAPVALVSFGYSDVGAETLGADVLLHHYSELAPACRRLLAARP